MNSDQLFYQKYLKYKNKYLELKELLGGRNPDVYNRYVMGILFKESAPYIDIRNVISKFIEDLIVKYALEKMNMTEHADRAFGLRFLEKIFKENISKYVTTIVDSMIWESTAIKRDSIYSISMNLIKVFNGYSEDNVHISLSPTGGVNNTDIGFHLTDYSEASKTSIHYNTKAGVYNFFNNLISVKCPDPNVYYGSVKVKEYLVLAVYAFNFFVIDNSHDLLETVLLSTLPEVNAYITMLSTQYIPRFLDSMLNNNLKPTYNYSDIYDNIKEVLTQGTKEETICCINKVYFNALIRQKEIEEAARRERTEAKAKADEDARVAEVVKCELAKVAAMEAAEAAAVVKCEKAKESLRANNIDGIRATIISTYGAYIDSTGIKSIKETNHIDMIHKLLESCEKVIDNISKPTSSDRRAQSISDKETTAEKAKANDLFTKLGISIVNKVINTTGKTRYKKFIIIPKGFSSW